MMSRAERGPVADWFRTVDPWLLGSFFALMVFGLVMALAASPAVAEQVVKDCREAGIARVWLYGISGKANSPRAVEFCRANGIAVIPGFCPNMFLPNTAWYHRFHGALLKIGRKYPA